MKSGDMIYTPRFCTVRIDAILTEEEATEQGYYEPTHYDKEPGYKVLGKHTGPNRMQFAAVKAE